MARATDNVDPPGPGPLRGAGSGRRTRNVRNEGPHRAGRGREVLRRGDRGRPRRPRGARRQLLLPARTVRMRQDLHPADDRRPRGDQRGPHLDRRDRRRRAGAGRAPDRHDVPELRAVPAPELPGQRRVQPADAGRAEGRAPRDRAREARSGPHGRLHGAHALAALRGAAAAGRACPRAGHQPVGAPARRAALRPRPLPAGAHARGAPAIAARPGHHLRPRHPFAAGGDGRGGYGGGHGPRPHRAGRPAAHHLQRPGHELRGALHRRAQRARRRSGAGAGGRVPAARARRRRRGRRGRRRRAGPGSRERRDTLRPRPAPRRPPRSAPGQCDSRPGARGRVSWPARAGRAGSGRRPGVSP